MVHQIKKEKKIVINKNGALKPLLKFLFLFGLSFNFACVQESGEAKTVTIFHTNDVHARGLTEDDQLDYAKIAGFVHAFKQQNSAVLLLDAGDAVQGLPISNVSRGVNAIEAMNLAGYDAMAVGNHEFHFGPQQLAVLVGNADFPFLSANIMYGGRNAFVPYILKNIDGLKIGIFGLSTPETAEKTNPKNTAGYQFEDPQQHAEEMVKLLRQRKADVIIALGHLGVDGPFNSRNLLENVDGIDVFVDGHSHTMIETGEMIKKTLLAQAGSNAEALGQITLEFSGKRLMKKSAKLLRPGDFAGVQPEPKTAALLQRFQESNKLLMSEQVGFAYQPLNGERWAVRTMETQLGQKIADAMREVTEADVAITNGGGIRDSIAAGPVLKEHVLAVFPFENQIVKVRVTGKTIKEALEHGISQYPQENGGFPHTSGLIYMADSKLPAGQRISNIMVNGAPLSLEASYDVAINDFLAMGGDGYSMFASTLQLGRYGLYDEVFANYLAMLKPEDWSLEMRLQWKFK